ncbi:MAG: DEAD/DEAH box helicase [Actinomycetota bacterium]|nr:DEAD/DEAH box helicase [Actinomycetota bacterium]
MSFDTLERSDLFAQLEPDQDTPAAYVVPIIDRILKDGPSYGPTGLILLPTRELAIQVHETCFQLTDRGVKARVLGAFEGKPLTSQIGPLKHGVDIVVGTPGRVFEHVKRKTLRIEQLKVLVVDRADEIQELKLGRELEAIVRETPKTRQTMLLSATTGPRILSFSHKHLRDPELSGITREEFESGAAPEAPAALMTNLYFGVGKGAGISPRDLVGAITNEGGLDGSVIGEIKIKQNFSLVAVPAESAKSLVVKLRSSQIKGRKTKIRLERF